ncbi:MAG: bifunctional glutamate N-acetyltransferase/amino-acid acetyltransferase ArgJ [Rhodobiaceae bacterium]|nr:bifunctional glutamate N-acetyltransferase/amino-acid acetyltransferase ArgJ [Rhodobiaceae bacterium]
MAKTTLSPLAPETQPDLPPLEGVLIGTAEAGIKYKGRTDLLVVRFDRTVAVAGVLTRSKTASAAVDWCRAVLPRGTARGIVVNSGNANAFTGQKGREATEKTASFAAKAIGCRPEDILLASTGVIGEPMNVDAFADVLGRTAQDTSADRWADAARAIMTTDTFPKSATATAEIDGVTVTINGITKGSGMIAPDMATMLGFIFTDAPIEAPVLHKLLVPLADETFNAITVDGDTSTSDTVLLFATGAAEARGAPAISDPADRRLAGFKAALKGVMADLAQQIVRDGEGASKFVSVTVEGAVSKRSARRIAMAIANSPLVKTAIAGEDANWGRIVMAIGKAGEPADRDLISIWFGDVQVASEGERHPDYSEAAATAVMKQQEIDIRVDLGIGRGRYTAWTCDFTHGYIDINADYRS